MEYTIYTLIKIDLAAVLSQTTNLRIFRLPLSDLHSVHMIFAKFSVPFHLNCFSGKLTIGSLVTDIQLRLSFNTHYYGLGPQLHISILL